MNFRPSLQSSAMDFRTYDAPVPTIPSPTWVRNPTWTAMPSVPSTEQKVVGLHQVWPDSNFCAVLATVSGFASTYTVNWGDGTTENFNSAITAYHQYDYTDTDLANTDGPVTFTASTSVVNRTSHGYTDGMTISFASITTTTGITAGQIYYVVNSTSNTFQVSASSGGSALTLTNDGSGTILPYKQALVTITPQAGQTFSGVYLHVKHNQTGLNAYTSGFCDLIISVPNATILTLGVSTAGSTTKSINFRRLERCQILSYAGTSLSYFFYQCENLQYVDVSGVGSSTTNISNIFNGCTKLINIISLSTVSATSMAGLFNGCRSLATAPKIDSTAATSLASVFADCHSLKEVSLVNTSNVTNLGSIFSGCYSLQSIPFFDTGKVTAFSSTFTNCYSLKTVPLFNTSSATDMSSFFSGCFSLQSVPFFNTANVTIMYDMFDNCRSLRSVPLFNTAKVTNMSLMFYVATALQNVPLFDTSSVTSMSGTFQLCISLQTIPAFNTSNVTTFSAAFNGCNILRDMPLLDTAKATVVATMHGACRNLRSVPLYNTSAATNFSSMFNGCNSLITIPLFDTSKGTAASSMFAECYALNIVPALDFTAVTTGNFASIFATCPSLSQINSTNMKFSFSVASCKLSATALNTIFTNLPTTTGQTITITGNWGSATCDQTIATGKGWTVTN